MWIIDEQINGEPSLTCQSPEKVEYWMSNRSVMKDWRNHIESKPAILNGKPVIKNTRIPVDLLLEKLSEGETIDGLLKSYPRLKKEDIFAAHAFAAEKIRNEIVYSLAS